MKNDSLGDRMKSYENTWRNYLPPHFPVIIRIDGKSFHSFAKGCEKPFDRDIELLMDATAFELCRKIDTVQIAYIQSDEISLLLHPYKRLNSQPWFGNNIQKMVSISAATATASFNRELVSSNLTKLINKETPLFDARVFILPECEVVNYFIWRQQDATRNSISMLAQSIYSERQLHGKNSNQKQEMIHEAGLNWNDLPTSRKRGRCIVKQKFLTPEGVERSIWVADNEIPIFTQDRDYIQDLLKTKE